MKLSAGPSGGAFGTILCYTKKAPNAWHRRGTSKTGNTYHRPQQLSTGTTHRPSTRHVLKGSPGVKTHNTNQHSRRARLHHSNHPSSLPTPDSVTTRSSQPKQPLRSTGGLSRITIIYIYIYIYNTERPPPQRGHAAPPPAWGGPFSGVADGQPRAHGQPLERGRGGG